MTMHPLLNTAVKAARHAGNLIVRYLDQIDRIDVEQKGENDFVTEVDRAAEGAIIDVIEHAYPRHAILAEESGSKPGHDFEWIIDPLDGTINFLHGYPQFSVSIAVRKATQLEHAVVFDPLRNEMFTASNGSGAHLNDRRMRVSRVLHLQDALIGTGFPFKAISRLDDWISMFRAVLLRSSGIRRAGSAALDLAYLACGRFDGFWELGLSPWDMAAGCLLIQESGGLVSDPLGQQDHLSSGDVVAGNPQIHPQMLKLIRSTIH
jgi:myo-inositol-1(or 4)-monophosphatase